MPSKKIIVTLIICISIIASVAIFQWKTNIKIFIPINNSDLVVETSTTTNNSDIQNWNNILTDTTGTTTILDSNGTPVDNNNLTAQMAKNYFSQFLNLSQSGTQITSDNADQIAQNTIDATTFNSAVENIYTTENIKSESSSNENVQSYFNTLSNILVKNDVLGNGTELDILNQAVISEKQSDIIKLDPIITKYSQTVNDLLKISVPSDAISLHLELLNNINNILSDMEYMKSILTDPVKGLMGIKSYEDHSTNLSLSVQKLSAYFKLKNIIK